MGYIVRIHLPVLGNVMNANRRPQPSAVEADTLFPEDRSTIEVDP